MRTNIFLLLSFFVFIINTSAQKIEGIYTDEERKQLLLIDSINKSMKYETGEIKLKDIATLKVPDNFKFLGPEQSKLVVTDIWGNPEDESILGMIFPADGDAISPSSYAFIVTYEDMGFVKDEDADEIDYDEMMKEEKESEPELNKEREKLGYSSIHYIGWAQKPFYDREKKVLHWAREMNFGGADYNTLNYDIRLLGRHGILSLNAVADMAQLDLVKKDIDVVLNMPEFVDGKRYEDFDDEVDKVAAYTIGGLVAGKVLAKAGFFVLILKFWKIIAAGVVVVFAGIRKFITGKKDADNMNAPKVFGPVSEEEEVATDTSETDQSPENEDNNVNTKPDV